MFVFVLSFSLRRQGTEKENLWPAMLRPFFWQICSMQIIFTNDCLIAAAATTITVKSFYHFASVHEIERVSPFIRSPDRVWTRFRAIRSPLPVKHKARNIGNIWCVRDHEPVKANSTRCTQSCVVHGTQSQYSNGCNRCQAQTPQVCNIRTIQHSQKIPKLNINSCM